MPNSTSNRYAFADALKRGLYEAIFRRRDIREFISDPIPDEVIARVLSRPIMRPASASRSRGTSSWCAASSSADA